MVGIKLYSPAAEDHAAHLAHRPPQKPREGDYTVKWYKSPSKAKCAKNPLKLAHRETPV